MIHCESCDFYYQIPHAWRKRLLGSILFFAKCPECGALRNENSSRFPNPRCAVCNCPEVKKGGMCGADYMIMYRQKLRFTKDIAQ